MFNLVSVNKGNFKQTIKAGSGQLACRGQAGGIPTADAGEGNQAVRAVGKTHYRQAIVGLELDCYQWLVISCVWLSYLFCPYCLLQGVNRRQD